MSAAVRLATARLLRVADQARREDPVLRADGRTSVADARAALCIAQGVPVDEIDPASGHDLSRSAYEDVRLSWRRQVAMHGFSEQYDRPRLESAVGWWTARRPQFTAGDDWLAGVHKPEPEGA